MTGAYFATAPCAFCQRVFMFDPERVPSIPANAWRIAEITTEGGEPPEPSAKVPICADCLAKINALRMQEGFEPITPLPGAYEPAEGFPP
jgi:hypothetical protein